MDVWDNEAWCELGSRAGRSSCATRGARASCRLAQLPRQWHRQHLDRRPDPGGRAAGRVRAPRSRYRRPAAASRRTARCRLARAGGVRRPTALRLRASRDRAAPRPGRGRCGDRRGVGDRGPVQRPRPLRGGAARRPPRRPRRRAQPTAPTWALPELVEAAARSGRREVARDALERLAETTQPSGTDFALGVEAARGRCSARARRPRMLYREAIERLGRYRIAVRSRPRPSALRRVAAAREPAGRRARATAQRPRRCSRRSAWRHSPSAPAAS